jgi:transcriptional regulator with XRE-family HTH domain
MTRANDSELFQLKERFAGNLIVARSRLRLSQAETARRASLHRTLVSLLERGERLPQLDTIVKLAGAVESQPCELLEGMCWQIRQPRGGGLYAVEGGPKKGVGSDG